MAITQVGTATTGAVNNGGSITATKPTGVASGDVLIASMVSNDQAVTAPSGFILFRENSGAETVNSWSTLLYYKICGSSEPADYTFTVVDTSAPQAVVLSAWRGVDNVEPIEESAELATTDQTEPASGPSITTSNPCRRIAMRGSRTVSPEAAATYSSATSGWSELAEASGTSGGSVRYSICQYARTADDTAGSGQTTPAITASSSTESDNGWFHVALRVDGNVSYAQENLYFASSRSGAVTTPANALGAADGTYTTDTSSATWTHSWFLDDLTSAGGLAGSQAWTLTLRKDSTAGNDPTVNSVTLYVNTGASSWTPTTLASTTTITDATTTLSGSIPATTFDGTSDWTQHYVEIATTGSGGGPSARRCVQVDAFRWVANYEVVASGENAPAEQVSATATANAATVATAVASAAGAAAPSAAAFDASVSTGSQASAGDASATATAFDVTATTAVAAAAGTATATASAGDVTALTSREVAAEAVLASATAQDGTTAAGATAGEVSAPAGAEDAGTALGGGTAAPEGAATAYDATVSSASSTDAPAGDAGASAVAESAGAAFGVPGGEVAASAEASAPAAALGPGSGDASAVAEAFDATVSSAAESSAPAGEVSTSTSVHTGTAALGASPSDATATAEVLDATVAAVPFVEVAAEQPGAAATAADATFGAGAQAEQPGASATAQDGAASLAVSSGGAAATAEALDATVSTSVSGEAPAGLASVSASAADAAAGLDSGGGTASGEATAYDATVSTVAATDAPAEQPDGAATAYGAMVRISFGAGSATASADAAAEALLTSVAEIVNAAAGAYDATNSLAASASAGHALVSASAGAVSPDSVSSGQVESGTVSASATAYGAVALLNRTTPAERTVTISEVERRVAIE